MASDRDTDELTGPPRETTDPSFPGPIRPSQKKVKTDPGFPPPSGNVPAAAPHEPHEPHQMRVSDTMPATTSAGKEAPVPAKPAARARVKPASDPPVSRSSARAESIDELIDGLAGDGHLPRKPKSGPPPAGADAQSSGPRKPSSPAPAAAPLPSILLKPDSQPDYDDDDPEGRGDPTVLTPAVIARRSKATTWIAGTMGVLLAVLVLALLRQATRGDDAIPPATTQATSGSGSGVPITPATTGNKAGSNVIPPATTGAGATPVIPSAAATPRDPLQPSILRSSVPAASASASGAPLRAAPSSSGALEEFRKTIRQ